MPSCWTAAPPQRCSSSAEVREVVLQAALKGWVLGSDSFVQELQQHTTRRLQRQKAGRPVRTSPPKTE